MNPLLMMPPAMALAHSDAELIAAAGGAPRVVRGWTLDPKIQFLEAQTRFLQAAAGDQGVPAPQTVRAQFQMLVALLGGALEDGVAVEAITIPADDGYAIPARVYRPSSAARGVMAYFHQGGGVIGDLDTCHAFCSILAAEAGLLVVSVEYRLAPEHPFPRGVEDALSAYQYVVQQRAAWGLGDKPVVVGGDSMGGHLSAIIAQQARPRGLPDPALQVLIYPALALADASPSMTDFADAYPLTADAMAWMMAHYLPAGADVAGDVLLSPGAAADLSGLAPALIYNAGFDPLVDQGEAYARRLRAAGVDVSHTRFEHLCHAFTAMTGQVPSADAACRTIARAIGAKLPT